MNRTGHEAKYVSHSGYVAELDMDSCSGCGGCDDICPFGAMEDPISDGGGYVSIDRDKCFGCGVCANLCGNGAVVMVEAPDKGLPMDVERLAST
jgi:formate hydrogenlyase subunit 6/NADH:ubiquinone oxidoreductase subunit I